MAIDKEFFFAFFLLAVGFTVIICDDSSRDILKSNSELYKEMGCVPVATDERGHALSYDCKHLDTRDNKNKCYYNGKVYSIHQSLTHEENKDPCLASCFCEYSNFDKGTKFTCAQVECPEWFGPPPLPKFDRDTKTMDPPCYYRHEVNDCCGSRYCPKLGEKIHTCTYQDKQYREGDRIYTENKECVCTKDFDGTLKDEWCREIRCKFELLYNTYLQERHCAPVFYNSVNGCPSEWICYNDTGTPQSIADEVETTKIAASEDSSMTSVPIMKCKLGPLQLHVGQKLKKSENNKCVECSCNVPPYMTCVKDEKCYLASKK